MKVGIALGGGGARGLAHLGVLKVLMEETGIQPQMMAGTSAGAIIGAMWGLYGFEGSLRVIRRSLEGEGFRRIGFGGLKPDREGLMGTLASFFRHGVTYTRALTRSSVLPAKGLELSLKELVGFHLFEDLPYPFTVAALELRSGKDVLFRRGPLWVALYASSAIPGVFPPLPLNGYLLVDGGPTMKVPIEALLLMGADFIVAVDVGGQEGEEGLNGRALEVMMRADRMGVRKLHQLLLSLADVVIRPDLGDMSWLDFERVDFAVERGMEAARRALPLLSRRRRRGWAWRWLRRRMINHLALAQNKVWL